MTATDRPRPPVLLPEPLALYTEVRPPIGPDGWLGYHYPVGATIQFAAYLDPPNRRIHVAATNYPWTPEQAHHIASLLTVLAEWLDLAEETADPSPT